MTEVHEGQRGRIANIRIGAARLVDGSGRPLVELAPSGSGELTGLEQMPMASNARV
jgi:hypothetical protein